MKVIKTPTGLIPVDESAQSLTQAEYNNLTAEQKNTGTYYIISTDGTSITSIIRDGVPLSSLPASSSKFDPPSGMTANTVQTAITENHNEITKIQKTITILTGANIKYTPENGLNSTTVQDAISENAKNINNMKHRTATVTASRNSWSGAEAPYTNTISVSGVTADNIVEVGLGSNASDDQVQACMKASIAKITQENGKIKLYAYGKKPEVDLPLVCVIVNV